MNIEEFIVTKIENSNNGPIFRSKHDLDSRFKVKRIPSDIP